MLKITEQGHHYQGYHRMVVDGPQGRRYYEYPDPVTDPQFGLNSNQAYEAARYQYEHEDDVFSIPEAAFRR